LYDFINDESIEIVKESIRLLGRLENKDFTLILKNIIESKETNDSVKECAVDQFWWNITDDRMLETLKNLIRFERSLKSVSRQFMHLEKYCRLFNNDFDKIDLEIEVLFEALNDKRAPVRKQVADVLSYQLIRKKV